MSLNASQHPKNTQTVRPVFQWALLGVIGILGCLIALIQLIGASTGEACRDSYSCRAFLVGGAECLDIGERSYCTRYCVAHAQCPDGWTCGDATATALTLELNVIDQLCIQDESMPLNDPL